jgi:hypothetical protein
MRTALQLILVVLTLGLGCASDPAASEKELSGVVRDRLSGSRISGATVRFTSDTLYTQSTRTDDDGHYEMIVETDTPLGQVRAEHPDYQAAETTVYFDAPERTIDLALLPIPE